MQDKKLEALIESLNLTEEKAVMIRETLKDMTSHTKVDPKTLKTKDAKLLLMAKMVEETDWRARASIAAALISIDL